MLMPKTVPTAKRRQLIEDYRQGRFTKVQVMKKLGLEFKYNQFNALFHNCLMN